MIRTMLVPLDGSPLAERALPYATALARAAGARLIVQHAKAPLVMTDEPEYDIAAVADRLRADGVDVEVRVDDVYRGEVAEAIGGAARAVGADLIVMSSHGRGGLGRWLYGSVADQVLRQATVPILLISAAAERSWPTDRAPRILVPLDGSPLAEEALGQAAELARTLGAEIRLLQVVEPSAGSMISGLPYRGSDPEVALARARRYLEDAAGRLTAGGTAVEVQVEVGHPVSTIVEVARKHEVDLIAMATHGYGGLARLVLGSVAIGTLQRAGAPLLLVRPSAVRQGAAEMAEPTPTGREDAPEEVGVPARSAGQPPRRQDPFAMLEAMQDEMARLWSQGWPFGPWSPGRAGRRLARARTGWVPRVDVFETGGELVVRAELPGTKKEEIDVSLDDADLVIRGERRAESEVREEDYYQLERSYGSFYRRLPLPFDVEADQIRATFADGILELRISKPAEQKPRARKITVS